MKRIILSIILALSAIAFAKSYKAKITGDVYIKTEQGELIQLASEDTVSDEDTIIISEKSSITFFVDGNKIVLRNAGAYKVSTLIK